MKAVVHEYVKACMICQQAKAERVKSPGLLQPLPTPTGSWDIITMDFIEGLPLSGNVNCILVVVDKFTKFCHFIPLKHPYTTTSVAKIFMDQVYKLHGLPTSIVSDRDPIFTSNFWRELFSLAQVTLRMSTTYHPQSDGQTERVNQCLETFLKCFVNAYPKNWLQFLPLAQFWYNTSFHSDIG
jgi:transposase InsO family protein